jgi:hypothetical protein
MNLGALPELLLSWIKSQGNILLQPGKAEPVTPFKPGHEYQGSVVSQLPSGRHLVRVAGQELDMNLPANTRAGESVRLTFLNAGPRPTFLLNAPPVTAGQPVSLSTATQQVSALLRLASGGQVPASLPSAAPAVPASATSPVSVPQATGMTPSAGHVEQARGGVEHVGRMAPAATPPTSLPGLRAATGTTATLSTVASAAWQPPPGLMPAATLLPAVSSRPIITNPAMLQIPLAGVTAYAGAVAGSSSGLPAEAIGGLRAAVPASTTLDAELLVELPAPSSQVLPERLAQTVRESGLFYEAHLAKWSRGEWSFEKLLAEPQNSLVRGAAPPPGSPELSGMSEESARLAGHQLQLLEGGAFQWLGQVWAGQWMHWSIEEQLEREGEGDASGQRQWLSEINMHLPNLGGVRARLGLAGNQLSLLLQAEDEPSQARMRQALPELVERLQAAGLQPTCTLEAGGHG